MLLKTVTLALLALSWNLLAEEYRTPIALPNVSREMTSPGFWISRHPSPDTLIMTAAAIDDFNLENQQSVTKNIFTLWSSSYSRDLAKNQEVNWQSIILKTVMEMRKLM